MSDAGKWSHWDGHVVAHAKINGEVQHHICYTWESDETLQFLSVRHKEAFGLGDLSGQIAPRRI